MSWDMAVFRLWDVWRIPVEVHLVNFRVVVLNLGVNVADKDREV